MRCPAIAAPSPNEAPLGNASRNNCNNYVALHRCAIIVAIMNPVHAIFVPGCYATKNMIDNAIMRHDTTAPRTLRVEIIAASLHLIATNCILIASYCGAHRIAS